MLVNIKIMYLLFTLSINNLSILLIIFIAVPLITTYKYMSLISLILRYIYLGVIIIFIIIGIMILNININLLVNPILVVFISLYRGRYSAHMMFIGFIGVVIIFILLLILIYNISNLLMDYKS